MNSPITISIIGASCFSFFSPRTPYIHACWISYSEFPSLYLLCSFVFFVHLSNGTSAYFTCYANVYFAVSMKNIYVCCKRFRVKTRTNKHIHERRVKKNQKSIETRKKNWKRACAYKWYVDHLLSDLSPSFLPQSIPSAYDWIETHQFFCFKFNAHWLLSRRTFWISQWQQNFDSKSLNLYFSHKLWLENSTGRVAIKRTAYDPIIYGVMKSVCECVCNKQVHSSLAHFQCNQNHCGTY